MLILMAITAVATVCYLALMPQSAFSRLHWMPLWLSRWCDDYPTFRNFPAFAATGLVCSQLFTKSLQALILTLIGLLLLATGLEVAQIWIPSRTFDLQDIAWSGTGVITGFIPAFIHLTISK